MAKAPLVPPFRASVPQNIWRLMSDVEKIKVIFSRNLDEMMAIIDIPAPQATLAELNIKLRVFEAMVRVGSRFLDARDTGEALERIEKALAGRAQALADDRRSGDGQDR